MAIQARPLLGITGILCAIFTAILLFSSLAYAQEENQELPQEVEDIVGDNFAAPVIFEGDDLFVVRGSSAFPADERAEMISARIEKTALGSESSSVKMEIKDDELGKSIFADGARITVTTSSDADLEQTEISVLAQSQAEAIENAIISYRTERSDDAIVGSVLEAVVWTIGFVAVFWIILKGRNFAVKRATTYVKKRLAGVDEVTNEMVTTSAMSDLVRHSLQTISIIILLFLTYYYLSFVLMAFAETRPIASILLNYVTAPILNLLIAFISYLPNLLALFIIGLLTMYVLRGVRLVFENIEAGTIPLKNFEHVWIWPTFNIIRVLVFLVALAISFPYIPGSGSAAFQGLTILVGVMVSLGSNSVIGNALSGLFVIYRRSTSIGDRVKIGEHIGEVVEIKLMETHIKSIKNELISIPNAQLLNSEVINYSTKIDNRGLLLHTTVGIGYEEPQAKIEAMLIEAANRTPNLLKSPVPFVLWNALADFAINYQINGYTNRGSEFPKTLSDLRKNIVDVFNENNVQIMTPSYIADPSTPKVPNQEWDGKLAVSVGKGK